MKKTQRIRISGLLSYLQIIKERFTALHGVIPYSVLSRKNMEHSAVSWFLDGRIGVMMNLEHPGKKIWRGFLFPAMAAIVLMAYPTDKALAANEVDMFKSPSCDCCTGWAEHLRKEGFTVVEHKKEDMDAIKSLFDVPEKLASCHTAFIGGYVIEGHVPADDIKRMLKEKPEITGLTAPGMPMKSPGMQKLGLPPKGYDVLSFDKSGKSQVYKEY